MKRLDETFFSKDVLDVAPALLGKRIVRIFPDNTIKKYMITEVEAYGGLEDLASHASKGITPRNRVMFKKGGLVYVYLIYGIHWLLNFVTGEENNPQAVLIRAIEGHTGPGRLSKELQIDKSLYGEKLCSSNKLWVEDFREFKKIITSPRIGIGYAGEYWAAKKWRYTIV